MKLTEEQKKANVLLRRIVKKQAKVLAEINAEKNQNPVKSMTITIEWKRSSTWGMNPHAEAAVEFHNGRFERSDDFTCSGCGYDKESTVVAEAFNYYLKYKLWNKSIEQCAMKDYKWKEESGAPYGIMAGSYRDNEADMVVEYRSFDGGIGMSCYGAIGEFIGGEMKKIASGKTFDVWQYTDEIARK